MMLQVLPRFAGRVLGPALTLGLALAAVLPQPLAAQEPSFDPVLRLNGQVITAFELEQRILFLKALRTPGDIEKEALDALIDDRLRIQEAKRLEIKLEEKELEEGLAEFASRADLSADEFVKIIGEAGVAPETFVDFVEAGLLWRQVVRARFGAQANVSDSDIDRALAEAERLRHVEVLLSELVIPAPKGKEEEARAMAEELRPQIGGGNFAGAARQFSAAGTAANGGAIDWMPLGNLPAAIGKVVLGLQPGEVSNPIPLPEAIALFQLRALRDGRSEAPFETFVDYLTLPLGAGPNAAAAAQRLAGADSCGKAYALAPRAEDGGASLALARRSETMDLVPGDIGLQLARLDAGESATLTAPNGQMRFVMLCARRPASQAEANRASVRERLINQKLGALADNYLADLKANAILETP